MDLLERDISGGRYVMRQALAKSLNQKLKRKGATETQQALLILAGDRKGTIKLVTTNFDAVFDNAAKKLGMGALHTYSAPMLPIPKTKWNGIAYLHGKLSKNR